MEKKIVYICSPCRGDYEKNIQKAREYCRKAMTNWPDVVPIAPHAYFTQFLDDTVSSERSLGMEAGIALLDMCDEIWVYGIDKPSEGMQAEIEYAQQKGIPIRNGFDLFDVGRMLGPNKGKEQPEEEMGDALISLPSQVGNFNGVAAIESTTVRISGEVITELAQLLRRNRGTDVTVEVGQ